MDQELKTARDKIKKAALVKKDDTLYAPLYHNISIFKRSNIYINQSSNTYIIRTENSKGLILVFYFQKRTPYFSVYYWWSFETETIIMKIVFSYKICGTT